MIINSKPYYLASGEKIPPSVLEGIKAINKTYSDSKDFPKYMKELIDFFHLEKPIITNDSKFFLGGFLEGEGSLNASAKKLNTAKFGVVIDPEFSVTQHINGVNHLLTALAIFQTGRIRHKTDSNATLVLTIENRQSLEEKVIPFFENYVVPFSALPKLKRFEKFKNLMALFKKNGHKDLNVFLNQILPLWDDMRMQKGQSTESFSSLEDTQRFVGLFTKSQTK